MRLKELRTELGLSQQKMAEAIGCQQTAYMRYERGLRQPSFELLLKMSEVFNVSTDYLLGKDVPNDPLLSPYEKELILAAREADTRAREDALALLQSHKQ